MEGQNEFTAQIMQAECHVSGISITGEVTGGFIRLSTRWFPATLNITAVTDIKTGYSIKNSLASLSTYNAARYEFFWPDVPLIAEPASPPENNSFFEPSIRRSTRSQVHNHSPISGTISCVMIATLDSGYTAFMVLGRAPSPTGAFHRLGIYQIHHVLTEDWRDSLDVKEFLIV